MLKNPLLLVALALLILCFWLAFSHYGRVKLGKDDDELEFSTLSLRNN